MKKKKNYSKGISSKKMSQLHWTLRKKGKTYKQALILTGKIKKISKKTITGKQKWTKKKYPYMDFDQDGKVNRYDCQPLNKKKQDKITREEIQKNKDKIYVYGDNTERTGYGGQAAEARGEPNAFGIATKKKPTWEEDAYFKDEEYEENKKIIDNDINNIKSQGKNIIIFPGIGEGRAKLKEKAPKTYEYLKQKLTEIQQPQEKKESFQEFLKRIKE